MPMSTTDDVRIRGLRPLLPPAILLEELPIDAAEAAVVEAGRAGVRDILAGEDRRLVVVVGPCSMHDPEAGLEYATRLAELAAALGDRLHVIMRVYFEKPRTIVGWKGLINDPRGDGSFAINHGLRQARAFLRELARLGLPAGTEFLDPISPQFMADFVSWGAIGARTVESQVHRELASGLSMPIGFKNGTGGSIQIAVDAIRSAAHPHHFLSVTKQGLAAIVETAGNPWGHLILRGGKDGPNYAGEALEHALEHHRRAGLRPRVMIDCSHGNSGKDHLRQARVAREVADTVSADGQHAIFGVMLESFLVPGRQDRHDQAALTYGQSVTDACMSWGTTVEILERLAEASAQRTMGRSADMA